MAAVICLGYFGVNEAADFSFLDFLSPGLDPRGHESLKS